MSSLSCNSHSQQGSTLFETLIALLILSVTLLAFTQTSLIALRENQTAHSHSVTNIQLITMAESLLACNFEAVCWQPYFKNWQQQLVKTLPQGEGQLRINGSNYLLKISWRVIGRGEKLSSELTVTK